MDGFKAKDNVLTIGTTNRLEDIDSALRRPGRFGTEFRFRLPSRSDRISILEARARAMRTVGDLPHGFVADETAGWSPAELDEIWTQAATEAIKAGSPAISEVNYVMGFERVQEQRSTKETSQ
ncbi:ATP-dependent zinc metalloprotease FtsH [compost metagenome]